MGFEHRVVTERELRETQERFLRGETTDEDRRLIDAALSYLAQKTSAPRGVKDSTPIF